MATLTLKAINIRQDNQNIFLASMKAGDILSFSKIDWFDPDLDLEDKNQGYQREGSQVRYRQIASYLNESHLMPTPIILSSREKGSLIYDEEASEIELDSSKKLNLIDGQHRIKGFEYGIGKKGMMELVEMEIPVIILDSMNKLLEMQQFYTINRTQRSVRTDLVRMILAQVHSEDKSAIPEKDTWSVVSAHVVRQMNDDELSPWHNLIIMPNQKATTKRERELDPARADIKISRATSFMSSIKPIYDYLKENQRHRIGITVEDQSAAVVKILIAFWSAVKELCPQAFKHPGKYVLQKTPGFFSLHMICKQLLPMMHEAQKPWDRWDKDSFVQLLDNAEAFTEADFWTTGGEGAKYGSMKGFRELADMIIEEQIKPEDKMGLNLFSVQQE